MAKKPHSPRTRERVPILFRRAHVDEIFSLRHEILRPDCPGEAAAYERDRHPSTFHFGAFADDVIIGCETFLRSSFPPPGVALFTEHELMPEAPQAAWQLRGMAIHEHWRLRGLGSELLHFAEQHLAEIASIDFVWCNARLNVIPFYRKNDYAVLSDLFDIPTVGPHVVMLQTLRAQLVDDFDDDQSSSAHQPPAPH